jgi:formyl-CoA transferase/CoA:oxalate CoA-transferase
MLSSGSDGDPPFRIGPSVIDKGSSLWAAIAILAALHERHTTGAGKYVDVSLLSTALSWLSYDVVSYLATGDRPARLGTAAPGSVPSQAFRTTDGHVHVAVGNDRIWGQFCEAIDRIDLRDDPRFARNEDRLRAREALVAILDGVFEQRTRGEWLERLSAVGIPCAPVNDVAEAIEDAQVHHLGLVAEVDRNGRDPFVYVRSPVGHDDSTAPPPELGQHTDDVLAGVLGLSSQEIESLRDAGAVA